MAFVWFQLKLDKWNIVDNWIGVWRAKLIRNINFDFYFVIFDGQVFCRLGHKEAYFLNIFRVRLFAHNDDERYD